MDAVCHQSNTNASGKPASIRGNHDGHGSNERIASIFFSALYPSSVGGSRLLQNEYFGFVDFGLDRPASDGV